ncbi:MAG: chromosomal replication initiator protein DnaA, partial [Candidatus Moranbacteria bacterium]|nr:chromosomal replication initiator protein DnaA [Candidatus Moranbacteria bacterium]
NDLQTQVGATSYNTWFGALRVKQDIENTLIIETPDDFFKNWIIDHYRDTIWQLMCQKAQKEIILDFCISHQVEKSETQEKIERIEDASPVKSAVSLNDRFTFDNFVVGPSNRFACAAGLAVAESPSKAYNPLFIYGQVGLGKTHLIQAITHKTRKLHPHLKIQYMTSEKFTNALIDSIRNRCTNDFRKKYRDIDVLLIDDIHFIAGKESTQEEFFHTFNFLHENHKQIIITSDRPPREINKLEERLSSRFAWGLITDIQAPDFETRVAILKKKIDLEKVPIPDDVISFIAEQIRTSIRELEGALIRVAAYAQLEDHPVTLEKAKMILKDMVRESSKTITIEKVQKTVAEYYNIPISELKAKRRNKNIVFPRQVAMYLSRKLTHMSLPEIGTAFGGKDHTTVLHSCKKIETEVESNRDLRNDLESIATSIQR